MRMIGAILAIAILAAPAASAKPERRHNVTSFATPAVDCFAEPVALESRRCQSANFVFPQRALERKFRLELADRAGHRWWVRRGDVVTDAPIKSPTPLKRPPTNATRT